MHSLRANQKLAIRIFEEKNVSHDEWILLKNHQNKQHLDIFYEFSNGGLFIILFDSV